MIYVLALENEIFRVLEGPEGLNIEELYSSFKKGLPDPPALGTGTQDWLDRSHEYRERLTAFFGAFSPLECFTALLVRDHGCKVINYTAVDFDF